MLISYHLFLGWLVITAEHEPGFSLPVVSTIFTHICCLVVILCVPTVRHIVPFFSVIRIGVTYIAVFERDWLFKSGKKATGSEAGPVLNVHADAIAALAPVGAVRESEPFAPLVQSTPVAEWAPVQQPVVTRVEPVSGGVAEPGVNTAADHEEWLRHLTNRKPGDLKRGLSIKDEYAQWMAARAKARAAASGAPVIEGAPSGAVGAPERV
jgi:hypothetical protein